jgi:hypothetical protein
MQKRPKLASAEGQRINVTENPPIYDSGANITTAIHIPRITWSLLRAAAFRRAQDSGGRASVSKLITELVERHRKELEQEFE